MPTNTLRPDGGNWGVSSGTLVPSGTIAGVTSDNSDSSYMQGTLAQVLFLQFGTFTLPAGAVVISAALRERMSVQSPDVGDAMAFALYSTGGAAPYQAGNFSYVGTTTVSCFPTLPGPLTQAEIDGLTVSLQHQFGTTAIFWRNLEAYVDVLYASAPTTTINAPTASQVITTTTTPTLQWTHNAGADGGAQSAYQVVVATVAAASVGGYDPLTGATVWSPGIVAGSATSVVCGASLPNSVSYRLFVRTAQTVNGAYQWPTSWTTVDFSISVTPPATPTLTATLQAASGRVQLVMATSTAVSALAYWEVQASTDAGTTWSRTVRGDLSTGDGFILASSNSLTRHDYEIGVNTATVYRARVTSTTLGTPITSAWSSTSGSSTWTPTGLWIKCPTAPALNISTLRARRSDTERRQGRKSVLYPIGRNNALVVSDARGGTESTIDVLTTSKAERVALDAILDRQEPLLLQGVASWELDLYAEVLDVDRVRPIRLLYQLDRYESLPYVETDRPSPAIPVASWPA
jgi:hypothetical protein